jgi:hypothetical protein
MKISRVAWQTICSIKKRKVVKDRGTVFYFFPHHTIVAATYDTSMMHKRSGLKNEDFHCSVSAIEFANLMNSN